MKIGVLSFYYKNFNYGGMLQAYALCRAVELMGYDIEQISFDVWSPIRQSMKDSRREIWKSVNAVEKAGLVFSHVKDKIAAMLPKRSKDLSAEIATQIKQRNDAFLRFQETIPHSKTVYTEDTVSGCANDYDVFIVGSDQVWNQKIGRPLYLLGFLPDEKYRIAYAASIAQTALSERQKRLFSENLPKFSAVSVREPDAVNLIEQCTSVPTSWVLDPTLLLTKEQWDSVCEERVISEKYIFCYFLGENKKARKLVVDFAKKKDLKIVSLPFLLGEYNSLDNGFGDVHLFDISPAQFIALIKHAEYVFTDSFHAAVFSNIYEKQYFAFNRDANGSMNSRIYGLNKLFGQENRFCFNKPRMSVKHLEEVCKSDGKKSKSVFEELKKSSISFLKDCLLKAEEGSVNGKN